MVAELEEYADTTAPALPFQLEHFDDFADRRDMRRRRRQAVN